MYEIVKNPYKTNTSACRKGLLLRGPWGPEMKKVVEREQVTALYLNSSKGWSTFDCGFLSSLPEIEELSIIAPSVTGLESLESLKRLKELEVTCSSRSIVDFSQLPVLERVYLYWWKGADSIFRCKSLRTAYLDKPPTLPSGWATNWQELRELTISNSPLADITELAKLIRLTKLQLHNLRRLRDFSAVSKLKSLQWLSISGCKGLANVDCLADLLDLEVLLLDNNGELESLRPLQSLKRLSALSFTGSTSVADGDLGILRDAPRLSMLGFASRRHYTHKLLKPWAWSNFGKPDNLIGPK